VVVRAVSPRINSSNRHDSNVSVARVKLEPRPRQVRMASSTPVERRTTRFLPNLFHPDVSPTYVACHSFLLRQHLKRPLFSVSLPAVCLTLTITITLQNPRIIFTPSIRVPKCFVSWWCTPSSSQAHYHKFLLSGFTPPNG
jgi:hypothetical protein